MNKLVATTYSSDSLSSSVRRLIAEKFGLPVLSTYEAVEAFKIGFECHQRVGIHLNIDLYPVRVVNAQGEPLPDGESGDVVVSNLVNRATVLLNYRLGDIATKLSVPCPCGRSLPLLSIMFTFAIVLPFVLPGSWRKQASRRTRTLDGVALLPCFIRTVEHCVAW
jgi:phenylacetate-coenzyme A ligase PaaK-like adenylate-forming protein